MKQLQIKCPTCSQKHDYYTSKPWSPFCSERCKMIDLGAWASEEHRIKGESIPTSQEQQEGQNNDISGGFIN